MAARETGGMGRIKAFTVWGVLMALALASLYAYRAPAPLPGNAPAAQFSAMRAWKHLDAFARTPHRAGTAANRKVEAYLVNVLKEMGVTAEVTESTVFRHDSVASPRNVIARIPGTAPTKAFLLEAHYDSVSWGPGAMDDGAGVASMLEVLRALKAGPPLRNDIVCAFTDGEESGLYGAVSFRDDNPLAREIGLMLNMEARGTRGPAYLFETSEGNGWLIPHIVKAVPCPVMSSMMFDIYKQMPTTSDFAILKDSIPGMNIASIDNLPYYHTPNDNPDTADKASLQHYGSYALGFAQYFGNLDLAHIPREPNAVYFTVFGWIVACYPGAWNAPIVLGCVAAFLAMMVLGLIRGRLSAGGLAASMAAWLGIMVLSSAAVALMLLPPLYWRGLFFMYRSNVYAAGALCLAASIAMAGLAFLRRRILPWNLAVGALAWWAVMATLMFFFCWGGAFLFTWPLLFASLGIAFAMWRPDQAGRSWPVALALVLAAGPGIVLATPYLYAFNATVTALLAPVYVLLFVMMLGLAVPLFEFGIHPHAVRFALGLLLAAIALDLTGICLGGFSAQQPKMNCLCYGLDANTGKAWWISTDTAPDEWTGQFFPPNTARDTIPEFGQPGTYLKAPACRVALVPPRVTSAHAEPAGPVTTLRLHLDSPRQAARMDIRLACDSVLRVTSINEKSILLTGETVAIPCRIVSPKGIDLVVEVAKSRTVKVTMTDYTYDLPDPALAHYTPRPPYMIAEPNTINLDRPFQSNTTMATKTVTISGT